MTLPLCGDNDNCGHFVFDTRRRPKQAIYLPALCTQLREVSIVGCESCARPGQLSTSIRRSIASVYTSAHLREPRSPQPPWHT